MRTARCFVILLILGTYTAIRAEEVLPSWNEGPTKQSIVRFVERVTDPASEAYVAPHDRLATFDNDGTLWSEKPFYFQLVFAVDRVREMAPSHPEWKTQKSLQAVLEGNERAFLATGTKGLAELVMVTHAGMTTDQFANDVQQWLKTARHPRFDRPYDQLVYQPMLELLDYLRQHEFQTFIVSGGGIEFIRVFSDPVYGVPTEQVIGSSIKTKFEFRDGDPVIVRLPEIDFIDDKAGKPVAINKFIGRRPIAAFGNSDGDLQMLQYTADNDGLCVIVHHTDAQREWAYDRDSTVGRLDQALIEAGKHDWTVVDMKQDWKTIYPPESK